MRRLTIISALLLVCGQAAQGQAWFADSLLAIEHRLFLQEDSVQQQSFILAKIKLYSAHRRLDPGIVKEIRRVRPELLAGDDRRKFLWNGALLCFLNEDIDYAAHLYRQYRDHSNDSSLSSGLFGLLLTRGKDPAGFSRTLSSLSSRDSIFSSLSCFTDVESYRRRHRNFYLVSSAIVPGSGTMMNGDVARGLLSLALTAGSVWGVTALVQHGLYINAVLWGTGAGLKFYTGNINLTDKTFRRREAVKKGQLADACELALQKVLLKYPLTLWE
jgi:hypothetical protein